MVGWITRYSLVIVLCVGVGVRYFRGEFPTLLIVLVSAALGVVGMGVADIVIHGRYFLANRAEAKRRRRAADQRCVRGETEDAPSRSSDQSERSASEHPGAPCAKFDPSKVTAGNGRTELGRHP
jgi:hypothetical protein